MADWVLVFPHEAVKGGVCAGRKIVLVTEKREIKHRDWICKKTCRIMPAGVYQVVKIA